MKEIYKNIEGYEGLYEVSNFGNIKSVGRYILCRDGQHKPVYERIISPGNNGAGYLFVYLWKNNKAKRYYIHQLVAKAFIENPNNYTKVNHKDFNKNNNNVNNLEWCTDSLNMAHRCGYKIYVLAENKKTVIDKFVSTSEAGRTIGKDKSTINRYCRKNAMCFSKYYNRIVYFSFKPYIGESPLKFDF